MQLEGYPMLRQSY